MEYIGLYAFVPAYDFSMVSEASNTVRIENDFTAWLNIMQRVNYMFKWAFDVMDLQNKSSALVDLVRTKIDELELANPQLGVSDYLRKLSEEFHEVTFNPLDEVWDEELKKLLGKIDDDEEASGEEE